MDKAQIAKYVVVAGGGYGLYWANRKYGWKMPPAVAGALGAGVGYLIGGWVAKLLTPPAQVVMQQQVQQQVQQPQAGFHGPRYLPAPAPPGGNGVRRPQTPDEVLADLGPLEGSFSDIDNSDDGDES